MVSDTSSDALLTAVIWTGTGALIVSLALLAAVALLRVRLLLRLAHRQRFTELWQRVFAACAESVPEELPLLAREDAALFLELWIGAEESLRGATQDRLAQLAHRVGAARYAVEMLGGGVAREELIALVALGHLRLRGVAPLAEALLAVPSPVISLTAGHALLRIDPARQLPKVIAVAGAREDWPVARVVAMLQECAEGRIGPSLAAALIEELRSGGAALPRLLRLLRAAPAEELRGAVLQILALAQAPETLAGALDALWHPEDAAHARRLVAHPEWFVRLAAAKALGRIGTPEDEPRLTALLADPSWWVRYRAAQSLAALPGMGKAALEALRQAPGMDRFGADILGQVIAEQGAT